ELREGRALLAQREVHEVPLAHGQVPALRGERGDHARALGADPFSAVFELLLGGGLQARQRRGLRGDARPERQGGLAERARAARAHSARCSSASWAAGSRLASAAACAGMLAPNGRVTWLSARARRGWATA